MPVRRGPYPKIWTVQIRKGERTHGLALAGTAPNLERMQDRIRNWASQSWAEHQQIESFEIEQQDPETGEVTVIDRVLVPYPKTEEGTMR